MTLRELRAAHPDRFYPQTWFEREQFMDVDLTGCDYAPPVDFQPGLPEPDLLTDATLVAQSYLAWPTFWAWRRRKGIWCADTDRAGHRVYLQDNGKGLEIHRYLALTHCYNCGALVIPDNFGTLLWL